MKASHSSKKTSGFTLVELIVVLVILATLAALLVPSLTGYIDKARQNAVIAKARAVLVASQAVVTEAYADGKLVLDANGLSYNLSDDDAPPRHGQRDYGAGRNNAEGVRVAHFHFDPVA